MYILIPQHKMTHSFSAFHAARMSSADLLDRFNAPLLYHGQDCGTLKEKMELFEE